MCGIFCSHCHPDVKAFRQTAIRMGKQVKHRGPDWSGNHTANNTILVHERLSIVGVDTGAQPILSEDGNIALAVNGEIYNHKILRKKLHHSYPFKTHSDCEVIIPLYQEYGIDAPKHLDGMFSWVLHDKKQDRLIAARDPIGITTFYIGRSSSTPGAVFFASELKCLHLVCDQIEAFLPGHVYDSKTDKLTRYYTPKWLMEPSSIPTTPLDLTLIRETFERSVRKRLMAEVPYGVLLSGGLDSSLVAAIAQRETLRLQREYAKKQAALLSGTSTPAVNGYVNGTPPVPNNGEIDEGLAGIDENYHLTDVPVLSQLNSFSIGLPGAPDGKAALEVARFLGTKHHTFTFTIQEGLDALYDVIFHLETYDVTTIRASTPMFLLSRKIKAMGVKMVLSGEGSDEIFGGYLYFHNAPDKKAFHEETVRRVNNLHLADCLRANKSTSAWGVEARVPFLDKEFLEVAMNIDPQRKMITKDKMEKHILRQAFDPASLPPGSKPYLPPKILWRQKEQFSDGVGYGWIDGLKDEAKKMVTDEQMKPDVIRKEKPQWGTDIPDSKEAYWYRCMFDEHFPPYCASTVMRWTPTWSKQTDPSGRAIGVHEAAYEEGKGKKEE
ncbi:asparagine synthetase [Friedmanniomyces endolithicus]|nr:asparagine synthetase [Friedmanniomyces endolithicus]